MSYVTPFSYSIEGNHIILVFIITSIWMFTSILLYLKFGQVCISDPSLSSLEKFKKFYDFPLVLASMATGSIILSFFYNRTFSVGHGFVLSVLTFIMVWLLIVIYTSFLSNTINPVICNDGSQTTPTDLQTIAKETGILTGFSMIGVLLAMILTWGMFRSEFLNFFSEMGGSNYGIGGGGGTYGMGMYSGASGGMAGYNNFY